MTRLSDEETRAALAEGLSGWLFEDRAIEKEFRFTSFPDAIAFIDRVALAAEDAQHHPDLFNRYQRVRVTLTTHDERGVSAKDIALARAIEAIADEDR